MRDLNNFNLKALSKLPIIYHETASGEDLFRHETDSYAFNADLKIFAVADPPLRILTRNSKPYPHQDFGKLASQTWCNTFVATAESIIKKGEFNKVTFKEALLTANSAIRRLNEELGKAYSDNENYDLAECVGMGAVAYKGYLYYGGLEDCYVMLQDGKTYEDKHEYKYSITKSAKFLERVGTNGGFKKFSPTLQETLKDNIWEAYWCNELRNNVDIKDEDGNAIGWGCFTGEDSVESFLQVNRCKYSKGDNLILISDGMIKAVNDNKFIKYLFENATPTFESMKEMRKLIAEIYTGDRSEFSEKLLVYSKL